MNKKIKSRTNLKKILNSEREKGKKVVFTNGCFELLHIGHSRYLNQAGKLGEILVVAVNSDSSVRKIKGNKRPIVPLKERMELLSNIECIDYVVSFAEETPEKIIDFLMPDVLVKGADYKLKDIVGCGTVINAGGKVVTIPVVKGKSTSKTIKRICRICSE